MDILTLAAKDTIVRKLGYYAKELDVEIWNIMVENAKVQILNLPKDKLNKILSLYEKE